MNSLWASRRIVATAASVPLAALAIAACGGGSDTPRPPKTASGRPATIGLEPARRRLPGPGPSAAKLTTTARRDGAPQVLHNGHPPYRDPGDAKPGDTNGQRVTAFGAAWFAVSGAGQVVSRPASRPGGGSIY